MTCSPSFPTRNDLNYARQFLFSSKESVEKALDALEEGSLSTAAHEMDKVRKYAEQTTIHLDNEIDRLQDDYLEALS